jgi:hypothetical protein
MEYESIQYTLAAIYTAVTEATAVATGKRSKGKKSRKRQQKVNLGQKEAE